MRWLHSDPHDLEEAGRRDRVLRKIDDWWQSFLARRAEIESLFRGETQWDLCEWMQGKLQAIEPTLMWEFGPAVNPPGHRLVITPEAERRLRPLVSVLLSRAPPVPNWEFYSHRLPESVEEAADTVRGICGGELEKAKVDVRQDGRRRIALTYYCPDCSRRDDDKTQLAAFVATEALLGEAMLDRWIGEIHVAPLAKDKPRGDSCRAISPGRLRPTVEAVVGSMLEQLPKRPCFEYVPDEEFLGYELQPGKSIDYPRRADLFAAVSARPDVFEAAHDGGVFHSDVHSRCGETFCYLKWERFGDDEETRYPDREALEKSLNKLLIPRGLGCVIGGGTGHRYAYADLALVDVPQAVEAMRPLLRELEMPARCWLHFFDDELEEEWIGFSTTIHRPPREND